jgi:hypothetical protein
MREQRQRQAAGAMQAGGFERRLSFERFFWNVQKQPSFFMPNHFVYANLDVFCSEIGYTLKQYKTINLREQKIKKQLPNTSV